MLAGGYNEDIYVVSPDSRCEAITELSPKIRFVSTGVPEPEPSDTLTYKGFKAFDKPYDLMIYSHSDVSYHPHWWERLKEVWECADKEKVWLIGVPEAYEMVFVTKPQQKLGLGIDVYNLNYRARFSPCTSMQVPFYASTVEKYGGNTYFNIELYLFYEALLQKKWGLLANNGCWINHARGKGDSLVVRGFQGKVDTSYDEWFNRMGYNLEHFISIWFGLIMKKHTFEIVDTLNEGIPEINLIIDYIFEDGLKALKNFDCENCEIQMRRDGLKLQRCGAFRKVWKPRCQ